MSMTIACHTSYLCLLVAFQQCPHLQKPWWRIIACHLKLLCMFYEQLWNQFELRWREPSGYIWTRALTTMPSFRPSPRFVSWSNVWMIYTKPPSSTPSTEASAHTVGPREPSNMILLIKQRMAQSPVLCVCVCMLYVWVFLWLWSFVWIDVKLTLWQDRNLNRQYKWEYITQPHITTTQTTACTERCIHILTRAHLTSWMLIHPTPQMAIHKDLP